MKGDSEITNFKLDSVALKSILLRVNENEDKKRTRTLAKVFLTQRESSEFGKSAKLVVRL